MQWPFASRHRSKELILAADSPSGITSRCQSEKLTSAAESTSASRHRSEKLPSEIDGTSCQSCIADIEEKQFTSEWADEAHDIADIEGEELTSSRADEAHHIRSEKLTLIASLQWQLHITHSITSMASSHFLLYIKYALFFQILF